MTGLRDGNRATLWSVIVVWGKKSEGRFPLAGEATENKHQL